MGMWVWASDFIQRSPLPVDAMTAAAPPVNAIQFNLPLGTFAGDANLLWFPFGSTAPGGSTRGGVVNKNHAAFGNNAQLDLVTLAPGSPSPGSITLNTPLTICEYFVGDLSTQQNSVVEFASGAKHTGAAKARFMGYDCDHDINPDSTGPFAQFYNTNFAGINNGTGTVDDMAAITGSTVNAGAGDVGQMSGFSISLQQKGTAGSVIDTMKGVNISLFVDTTGGTATTAMVYYADGIFTSGGTLTNAYGVYIEDQSAGATGASGESQNIRSKGANSINVFEGVITAGVDVVVGTGTATNATKGFLYLDSGAGTPTGVPTSRTGTVPMYFDTTNSQLWIYAGGAWKQPKTPAGAALVTWQ